MTDGLVGLMLGLGLFCVWWSFWPQTAQRVERRQGTYADRLRDDIVQAGMPSVTVGRLLSACTATGFVGGTVAYLVTTVPPLGLAAALAAAYLPLAVVRSRARKRRHALREVWPDVVDHISSAVRAGMALPESLAQLAVRGPDELRPAFADFAQDYRASGRFHECLDALKVRLSDPVADRLIESLRIAREVGGTDLGRLLRTLSSFLREDARTRAELEARQSWTVNAARLALLAPWIVLGMLATRGSSLDAYREPAGVLILMFGGAVSFVAYRIMRRIGRLPEEVRVLR
ncbi:type II secretion system F family protein [Luteipulveratus flavus]|uniref:Type II secretion system F family protein n=1 Tax=Luteipulveratus flavus TaxID=3031728 RepID=A0ABT6CA90_9MICO|nr:type II secretion system F family protein [Luteipulveratus sp. YIM 133296]MDF8264206.1 type II secretion system F family protein [Luteipulveratus sp. YIM 133296]